MRARESRAARLDDPTPRESLYERAASWTESKPPARQRTLKAGACAVAVAAVVGTVAFGVSEVSCGEGWESTGAEAPAQLGEGAGGGTQPNVANKVFGLDAWTFLATEETSDSLAGAICSQLAELGMGSDCLVYVVGTWEATEEGYVGWVRTSPADEYWRVDIATPGFVPKLAKTTAGDVPTAPDAQDQPALSALGTATPGQGSSSPADTRDLSGGIALTDVSALKSILPDAAAESAQDVLVAGVSQQYGFPASAALSKIYPETAVTNGSTTSFTAIFMDDAYERSLVLSVDYDGESGGFYGRQVEE